MFMPPPGAVTATGASGSTSATAFAACSCAACEHVGCLMHDQPACLCQLPASYDSCVLRRCDCGVATANSTELHASSQSASHHQQPGSAQRTLTSVAVPSAPCPWDGRHAAMSSSGTPSSRKGAKASSR